jgi:hypothetical protein
VGVVVKSIEVNLSLELMELIYGMTRFQKRETLLLVWEGMSLESNHAFRFF